MTTPNVKLVGSVMKRRKSIEGVNMVMLYVFGVFFFVVVALKKIFVEGFGRGKWVREALLNGICLCLTC